MDPSDAEESKAMSDETSASMSIVCVLPCDRDEQPDADSASAANAAELTMAGVFGSGVSVFVEPCFWGFLSDEVMAGSVFQQLTVRGEAVKGVRA